MSLDTAARVPEQDFLTLGTTKFRLIAALHAQLADIVTALVVLVSLQVIRVHLTHIAQDMGSIGMTVLTDASFLDIEAREPEQLLLKTAELLGGKLAHEKLLGKGAVSRITPQIPDFSHPALVPFPVNMQALTQVQRIHANLLVHNHHHVIGRLIVHQQLPVTVGDDTAGRILDTLQEGIAVSVLLEVIAQQLQHKQPYQVYQYDEDCRTTQYELPFLQIVIDSHTDGD